MTRSGARRPARTSAPRGAEGGRAWTFLSNHAHVLICVAAQPAARIQDIAEQVGITYRGVQRILRELEEAGYLSHRRASEDARSNVYRVERSLPLRHPLERHQRIAALLDLAAPRRGGA
jgi:predicted ArsR family transcriptional regulator